jgi:hypothetical protein
MYEETFLFILRCEHLLQWQVLFAILLSNDLDLNLKYILVRKRNLKEMPLDVLIPFKTFN